MYQNVTPEGHDSFLMTASNIRGPKFSSNISRRVIRTFQVMLVSVLVLGVPALPDTTGTESDVSTVVNCATCRYTSWPRDAWECDVKCNVVPTGVLTYGK